MWQWVYHNKLIVWITQGLLHPHPREAYHRYLGVDTKRMQFNVMQDGNQEFNVVQTRRLPTKP